MDVVVIADTHIRDGGIGRLPASLRAALAGADVILHAGDVVTAELLDELAGFAPVHAVLGNNDDAALAEILPDRLCVDLDGVTVAMVHDSGATKGRPPRMRRWFPDADVVVFGHSHMPVDEHGMAGQRLFNPGSPTQRRRQPHPSFGRLQCIGGALLEHSIEPISRLDSAWP